MALTTDPGRARPPRARQAGARVAALALGTLPALAFPEPGLWWLGFVGLAPLLSVVTAAGSGREAGVRAWLGGAGFFVAVHHWLIPVVGLFAVPLALLLGALWVPWGRVAWRLLHRPASARQLLLATVLVPSAWVAAELVRSWEHLGGPWAILGTSQWSNGPVLGLAALGGVWAISFVLVAVNVALVVAMGRRTAPSLRVGGVLVAAAVLGATAAWSAGRAQPAIRRHAVVAGVQPGVTHGPEARFRANERATLALASARPELMVWGESSVGFDPEAQPRVVERTTAVARAVGGDVLVNVDARRGRGGIFKSSLLVGPNGPGGRYDKMRLVPFGEYIPLRPLLGWVSGMTPAAIEDRRRGTGLDLLRSPGLRVGPLVCFESAFPDLPRHLAARGADLVVVQSATTTFQGSWAQAQHASLAALRAVESGRAVVHTALSGVSAVYDASGRRLAWLPADRRGTFVARVPVSTGTTPYVRFGDWVPYGSLALLAGWALWRGVVALRHRRRLVVAGAVAGQLGEEPGDDGHPHGAGQAPAHRREAGAGQGGDDPGLGVAQPGATRDHGDVGRRHPPSQGVGDVELQDGVAEHR